MKLEKKTKETNVVAIETNWWYLCQLGLDACVCVCRYPHFPHLTEDFKKKRCFCRSIDTRKIYIHTIRCSSTPQCGLSHTPSVLNVSICLIHARLVTTHACSVSTTGSCYSSTLYIRTGHSRPARTAPPLPSISLYIYISTNDKIQQWHIYTHTSCS